MTVSWFKTSFDDPHGTPALARRLLAENALVHWKRYAAAFGLMGVAAACTALSAHLLGDVINQAYVERSMRGVVVLGGITLVLFIVKGLATYGHAVILSRIGARIIAANQRRMFDKLLNEGLAFFADRHSSEFVARLTTGANSATYVINLLITAFGRDLLLLIALIIVMVTKEPMMSLVSVLVVPPAMLVLRKLVRRIKGIARNQFTGSTQIIETMQEMVQGIRVVKAFTLEEAMRARLDSSVEAVQHESIKLARVANRSSPLMETLGGVAISIAIIYCGYRVIVEGSNPGEFFAFITAFLLAYEPAKRLARLNLDLNSNMVGVRVMFEIIDTVPTEPIEDGKPAIAVDAARIAFEHVNFAYRPGEPVMHDVSFVAEPSRMTALVGPSGGGKSTVLNLLLRYYDVGSGRILIDGADIAAHSRRSLRRHIAFVGQNVHLFSGTIRENIAFGRPGATDTEIVAAARAAYAHDFIVAFPKGYDTPVGEHGHQLSGGQRQRIAIARALVKDAPIILLDEATAALDSESERYVQDAIAILCKGRTTIVVAHRLSTIMHADKILVIEGGKICETGRHDELLRRGGRYASFFRLQLQHDAPDRPAAAG
jgi:ATP-binding cassette subfamily B protein